LRRPLSLAGVAIVAIAWNAALLTAPAVDAPRLSAAAYLAGSLICHQRPERSFHLEGVQYPVCARCLGLYVGSLAGILAWAAVAGVRSIPRGRAARFVNSSAPRSILMLVAAPTVASVALAWAGAWDGSNLLRATLAAPLGAVIAAVVAATAAGDLR
jgi:uncharacterized membrane protein